VGPAAFKVSDAIAAVAVACMFAAIVVLAVG
jgi:hypothetical protein